MWNSKDNVFKSNQKVVCHGDHDFQLFLPLLPGAWLLKSCDTSQYMHCFASQNTLVTLPLIFPSPQNGAMTMAWTTRLERSGIVRGRMARWWAAPVLEMEKENSSVILVRCHTSFLGPYQAPPLLLLSCSSHSQKWLETLGILEEGAVGLLIFRFGKVETSFKNEPWFNVITGHMSTFPAWVFWP